VLGFLKRAVELREEEYHHAIKVGLNRAFDRADREVADLSKLKVVVFSDLHRGARDGADDFERCERAYSAALDWYTQRQFHVWLLGDVEELWENGIDEVWPCYPNLLALEGNLHANKRLRRFYGNHDLDWRDPGKRKDYLPSINVGEALRLAIHDQGKPLGVLFFVHGHQGTLLSDRLACLSRFGIRKVWRPLQRLHHFVSTTPSENSKLRHHHDIAMYLWAKQMVVDAREGEWPVLIAGHTHHPIFPNKPPPAGPAVLFHPPPHEMDFPCYFNTGCCCFPDRDVTCLEINGDVRLVRWLGNEGEVRPEPMASPLPLRDLFAKVAAG
jgi:calcineurin-like phosphoesterase family protein